MKKLLLALSLICAYGMLGAQVKYKLEFAKNFDTVTRTKGTALNLFYAISSSKTDDPLFNGYSLIIEPDAKSSSLSSMDFALIKKTIRFADLPEENNFLLQIKPDTLADRDRTLTLNIKVIKSDGKADEVSNNTSSATKLTIVVKGIDDDKLYKDYSYLGYIGTNFDLVDGIKAKNLFFALNTFLPPTNKSNKVGVYLSLYGNRTMTTSDSSSNIIRTSKHVRISDTTYWRFREQSTQTVSRVSDNLGAYINPLIKLWSASKDNNSLKLYYSPSLEFVWRRTETTSNFSSGTLYDSILEKSRNALSIEFSRSSKQYSNEFMFNIGLLGFFLAHENKQISMRVHMSVGYSSSFLPERPNSLRTEITTKYERLHYVFFSGRAWITEGVTGLTFQAEITNTMLNPRPFYGVTLSKAFNFKNLSSIFQPITTR